jgi:hypothetical protein
MPDSMAAKPRAKKRVEQVLPEDLQESVREAVFRAPGSTVAQIVKALPASYRGFVVAIRAAAETLADTGKLFRHFKTKATPLFFPAEPMATLDAAIQPRLTDRVLDKDELKRLVEEITPGHGVVLDAWLKRALERGALHEHAPKAKTDKKKRYGRDPDLRKLFAPVFTALRKAREGLDERAIPRQRFAKLLLEELEVSLDGGGATSGHDACTGANGDARSQFISALAALGAENPRQALLSVRELRSRLGLAKAQFDAVALDLMRDGAISLHHHDHPASLPEVERRQLIQDASGTFYVGIAPRSTS